MPGFNRINGLDLLQCNKKACIDSIQLYNLIMLQCTIPISADLVAVPSMFLSQPLENLLC
jgi:hypothetical protein